MCHDFSHPGIWAKRIPFVPPCFHGIPNKATTWVVVKPRFCRRIQKTKTDSERMGAFHPTSRALTNFWIQLVELKLPNFFVAKYLVETILVGGVDCQLMRCHQHRPFSGANVWSLGTCPYLNQGGLRGFSWVTRFFAPKADVSWHGRWHGAPTNGRKIDRFHWGFVSPPKSVEFSLPQFVLPAGFLVQGAA